MLLSTSSTQSSDATSSLLTNIETPGLPTPALITYADHVAHNREHRALDPHRFTLDSTQATALIEGSAGNALKQHIEHYYGKPPVTKMLMALGDSNAAWSKHLVSFCAAFGQQVFEVPGHDNLYMGQMRHPTQRTPDVLALRVNFNSGTGIDSLAIPLPNESSDAKRAMTVRLAIDMIENVLAKTGDAAKQIEGLAFFTRERIALLPAVVREQFQARLKETRSDDHPPKLREGRAKAVLALWEQGNAAGRKEPAERIRKCLEDKKNNFLRLTNLSHKLTDRDLSNDLDEVLENLTHLKQISFYGNLLTHVPPALHKMSKLERFDISGNKFFNRDSV